MTGSSMEQAEEVPINPNAADRPFKFTRKERISQSQDFKRVMKFGKRLSSKNFALFILKNANDFHRLGLIVKKEVGIATFRNRIKRYLREFFRLHNREIKGSFDIVILVKKGCSIHRYLEVEEELKRILFL